MPPGEGGPEKIYSFCLKLCLSWLLTENNRGNGRGNDSGFVSLCCTLQCGFCGPLKTPFLAEV